MRTIEESLQILDNMPDFQKRFEAFKLALLWAIDAGFHYRGNPIYMKIESEKQNKVSLGCIVDGKKKELKIDMPEQLFDAGYRFDQFGSFFITTPSIFTGNRERSTGNAEISKFKCIIMSSIRYQFPDKIYDHDTDGILLALIGRFVKPSVNKSEPLKFSLKVNSLELINTLVIKQTARESVADSHHEYAARSEQIEKRKTEFQQKRLKAQQKQNINI